MPAIVPKSTKRQHSSRSSPWFWLGMAGIFILSLALRFWGLSRFNTLVFDEVYYAKFASHFLKGEIVFTGHPPLSTYIIAFGIWLGERMPWGDHNLKNGLAGLLIAPFSYRWLNALTGSLLPLVVAAIAYQLSNRRSYALIAGLLLAADGLFLVESRYALNNVYLLLFGLLGQLCFLLGLRGQGLVRWLWLGLAGIGFGASAAIKWNGLGFLLGAFLVWAVSWILRWLRSKQMRQAETDRISAQSPLQNLTQLHLGHLAICLGIIPALTYYVSWLPYIALDPSGDSFWTLQTKTLSYHARVGGLTAHPYCSLWFTWPLMLRPIAYFYKTSHSLQELPPVVGPPLPQGAGEVIYDVHAMGNPILWWFSTAAIALLLLLFIQFLGQRFTALKRPQSTGQLAGQSPEAVSLIPELNFHAWILLYLGLNWIANLLPWLKVSRCAFLYHYMESFTFALLLLALLVDRWLQSPIRSRRNLGVAIITLVLLGFVFWMPI
jgi:dolichyl-phosphate-mannose-protein mannosyltransferase